MRVARIQGRVFQQAQAPAMRRLRPAMVAQPVEPIVGMPAQELPGERKAVQMQHVQIRGSRIPRLGAVIDHDATSREQDSPPRKDCALHRHRQKVMGQKDGSGCQDRLAPMRCGIRLNAAATAPRVGVLHRPACRSPRQPSCLFGSDWRGYAARMPIETCPA
ncbi:hypothetical protein G6F24_014437 [Rhizopus arrhizus]|nr:hypothetical protein G6F24_014437 [Rhizopus arrhizus]